MTAVLGAAFAAGMVSTVNPCGFAMLPAYLGFFLGAPEDRTRRLGKVTAAMGAGFLVVFTVAGILLAVGLRALVTVVPWLALVVGVGLVVVGGSQLAGKRLIPYLRGPSRARKKGSFLGIFTFGVSYAVASLSCTLPIFLSIVGGTIASGSPVEALLAFVAYAAGMSLVVGAVTTLVALGRTGLVDRIRPLAGRLDAIAGVVMVASGLFIVWYWATILNSGSAAAGSNPVLRWVDERSSELTSILTARPLLTVAVIAVFLVVAVRLVRGRRRHGDRDQEDHRESVG